MENLDSIKDNNVRSLARKVYDILADGKLDFKSEIEVDDVYFQVERGQTFVFSIDIRGNLTEFYLKRINFTVLNNDDFDAYAKEIIFIIGSIIKCDFKIVRLNLFGKILKSEIIFSDSLCLALHTNFILSQIGFLFPGKVKKVVEEGEEYLVDVRNL